MHFGNNSGHNFYEHCRHTLDKMKHDGRYRNFTPLGRKPKYFPHYEEYSEKLQPLKDVVVWSTNDYLGMGSEPVVMNAAIEAIKKYGVGAGGTRNVAGTNPVHKALENELASFHQKEAGLLFISGYMANLSGLQTILQSMPGWICFSDELNHASMIAGIKSARKAQTQTVIFKHNDLQDLEEKLSQADPQRPKMIAFESVYSMDGDISDIPAICRLAKKYGAFTYLDEVHAVGLYGEEGGGVACRDDVADQVDIIQGTLSKSFGAHGGYITGNKDIIDYLRSTASGFIFTTSLPPAVAAAALEAIKHVRTDHWRRERLFERVHALRQKLRARNVPFKMTPSHIIPIPVGNAPACKNISRRMLEEYNHYITPINAPTVPVGTERLRITPGPSHSDEMMDDMVEKLAKVYAEETSS